MIDTMSTEEKSPAGNSRAIKAALAGLGLVVLFLAFKFLTGGDPAVDPAAVSPVVDATGVAPNGVAVAPVQPGATSRPPRQTLQIFSNKNPFPALIDLTPNSGGSSVPSVGTAGSATAPSSSPSALPVTPPAPASSSAAAPSSPTALPLTSFTRSAPAVTPGPAGQAVLLLDVFVEAAGTIQVTVQIDEAVHTLEVGERFASSFRVETLDDSTGCAQFLYGDELFQLCEGRALIK